MSLSIITPVDIQNTLQNTNFKTICNLHTFASQISVTIFITGESFETIFPRRTVMEERTIIIFSATLLLKYFIHSKIIYHCHRELNRGLKQNENIKFCLTLSYTPSARTAWKTSLLVVQLLPWEHVWLYSRYSVTVVVYSLIPRLLPGDESICRNTFLIKRMNIYCWKEDFHTGRGIRLPVPWGPEE